MLQLNSLDTPGPIDFDNLNITIRPLPPQRRQSGISIIPFRPYVKRLTSVREPFSYANGRDSWVTTGQTESFFRQDNARCIGSLMSDCGISEVIRWDIEGESTRLPMMCKLWMIVDGAVVERGKPRMVQDAAVQVYTAGRSLISILSFQHQQAGHTVATRYDRRRRHSWHDVNEYHSVPYFQYTSYIQSKPPVAIQCDIDNEHSMGWEEHLPFIEEETADEHHMVIIEEHNAQAMIHDQELPQNLAQISMTKQTNDQLKNRSTSIDSAITLASHLNSEITETSHDRLSIYSRDTATGTSDDIEYSHQSVSTHDDVGYSNRSVSTRDDAEYTHQSIATGNDTEYSDQSVATHADVEYSDRSVSTYDDVKYSNQSVATQDDIEYSHQSVSTRDDVDHTHHSIATGSDIEYSNQSVATHDDVGYSNQSVSTRDDLDQTYHSIATGSDIEYSNQSVATHDHIRYSNQSVSTRDDLDHTHQSIATGSDIEYSNQSVATHDNVGYSNQSVSTRDDLDQTYHSIATGSDVEYSNRSVSTRDDIEYFHQSVATHDDIEYSHQSVATHDDIGYSNQSVSTQDHIKYSNQSVSTRDDVDHTHHSIATGNDIEYSNQSVSTRDDIGYSHQSVSTHDGIAYSHQSVATHDDIGYSNQSVSTRDDIECLNRSVSTRDDVECLNRSVSTHDDVQYSSRSTATGGDYPDHWLQFSTNDVLSEYNLNQNDDRDSSLSLTPRQHDRSIQRDTEHDTGIESEQPRPPSSRSSRPPISSSSVTMSNHYQVLDQIDDENNTRRSSPFISHRERLDSPGDLDSHFSDYQTETSSSRNSGRSRRVTSSSKQSDTGYNSFESTLNRQEYSTADLDHALIVDPISTNEISHTIQTGDSGFTSISLLESLSERYEKTLRDRRQAIAVINDQLLDIGDVLQHYRQKIRSPVSTQSNKAIQVSRDIVSTPPKQTEERPLSPVSSVGSTRIQYRYLPSVSHEEMIQEYTPSSRLYIPDPLLTSPRQRSIPHTDYCDICLTDHSAGSAWIRYNEQRLERVQQRIDLMLELDDIDEGQYSLSTLNSMRNTTTTTTTQRIDDILMGRSHRRNELTYQRDRTIVPRRSNYRSHSVTTRSPRFSARTLTRSASPASKRVRISTNHILIPNQTRLREPPLSTSKSVPRPIVSILRRNNPNLTPRSHRLVETSPQWSNAINRRNYMIEQENIPRYYRLYNDVGFREVYDFSRVLDSCLNRTTPRDYSSMIRHFALEQQYPTSLTSVA